MKSLQRTHQHVRWRSGLPSISVLINSEAEQTKSTSFSDIKASLARICFKTIKKTLRNKRKMMKLICISFILVSLISALEGQSSDRIHVSDKGVTEIANFVVSSKGKPDLVYEVVQATRLPNLVGEERYDLVISAKDSNGKTKSYRAVVSRALTVPPTMSILFFGEV